jgi:hypothetical protein
MQQYEHRKAATRNGSTNINTNWRYLIVHRVTCGPLRSTVDCSQNYNAVDSVTRASLKRGDSGSATGHPPRGNLCP